MNTIPIEAKVRANGGSATGLLIRTGDVVIETRFSELATCEFPIRGISPILVEIPPHGTKDYIVGAFSGSSGPRPLDGEYPHTIRFPVYTGQAAGDARAFDKLASDGASEVLAKAPLVAVATAVSGHVEGKLVQTHCVLPIWRDGSAVLVVLDWSEGEPAEGAPDPEWHLRSSSGFPANLGLAQLERASRIATSATDPRYRLYVTPWLLAAQLLDNWGTETSHRVWQRQWEFEREADFALALARVAGGLVGPGPSGRNGAA